MQGEGEVVVFTLCNPISSYIVTPFLIPGGGGAPIPKISLRGGGLSSEGGGGLAWDGRGGGRCFEARQWLNCMLQRKATLPALLAAPQA